MLLRLLPLATPSQPAPPTILFTLPLPTHPYTSRSLPLPPNLLAHRSVCLQEDIECSNVLLGEKSSWIGGIIDDVTFSLPDQCITVHLIDGSTIPLPLTAQCMESLRSVIQQVQLSFAPPPPTESSPRSSVSSIASNASTSSASSTFSSLGRTRSPSALLLSLISPLLPGAQQSRSNSLPKPPVQPAARLHRRQARSILVDTYRRHVLPLVRESLPTAYLPWAIASETARSMEEFETLRTDINSLLSQAGVDPSTATPMSRTRSSSTSSDATDSDSDSETRSPVTPATSIFGSSCSTPPRISRTITPQSFLLSIPPAHVIPVAHRNVYAAELSRLTRIASRLSAIKKLQGRYEREEGKRKWLEGLERGRSGDKALRRAFSNGQLRGTTHINAEPTKRTGLWRSWTAEDQEHEEVAKSSHPAMMAIDDGYFPSMDEKHAPPPLPRRASSPRIVIPSSAKLPSHDVDQNDVFASRPIIPHRPAFTHRDSSKKVPALVASRSKESLAESDTWDEDNQDLLPPPSFASRWESVPTMVKPIQALVDWDQTLESIHDVEVEVFHGIGVVCP